MTTRWARVGELFDRLATLPAEDLEAALEASGEPDEVRQEVRSLLAAHDSAGRFLDPARLPRAEPAEQTAIHEQPERTVGTVVGPYRIVRVIGRGGMGVVYEAKDTRLGRRVALKSLPAATAGDERQRQRLRQEARAAAALQHPGIATVYALEEIDGQVFISSELLAGETLREVARRGPLTAGDVTRAAVEIAHALRAAHDRGVVHRDLKPENIVRTTNGALKILDFGLAQIAAPETIRVSNARLTQPGLLVGTPAYMAPEQLLGRPTDFRADHFAFGVMLAELSTGAHPFGNGPLPATIARILADAPDRAPSASDIPPALWRVIDRCLQKEPNDRYASTDDLLIALESAAAPAAPVSPLPPAPVPPVPPVPPALRWWRFHQFAAAATYWAAIWPMWHVHRSLGRAGLFFFFATLAAVVVAANLRLHLWFSSRVYPEDLLSQRADVARWIWWADMSFAVLLVSAGIVLPGERAGWAAVLISIGVGSAVAFVLIEPATARAALSAVGITFESLGVRERRDRLSVVANGNMSHWGGQTPPSWIRELVDERPRPLVSASVSGVTTPQTGDIVLKPFIDGRNYQQLFRLETWDTHDLLDGPFDHIKKALESALEFGLTSRLVVWLDYSDDPDSHDLDEVPLFYSDTTAADAKSVA